MMPETKDRRVAARLGPVASAALDYLVRNGFDINGAIENGLVALYEDVRVENRHKGAK